MKELTIAEIKAASFEVLCAIRDLCEKNGISYSLTGGTLIGAVRHKGFIPWDDDIDIMMPRPDYDRFIAIAKEAKDLPIRILSAEICGSGYPYAFAKACHPDTLLIEDKTVQTETRLGVYVDIFPVDGIGDSYKAAKWRTLVFRFLYGLKVTSNWTGYRRSKLRKWYFEPLRYVCYLCSRMLGGERIDRWLMRFVRRKDFSTAAYAGRLVGDYGSREIMERSVFETTAKVEFEGQWFDAIADYDTFLTSLYGTYMELPPEEKRKTHHEFKAYWTEQSK